MHIKKIFNYKKGKKTHITNITADTEEIKWIRRENYEQLHNHKFDNLDEMDRAR